MSARDVLSLARVVGAAADAWHVRYLMRERWEASQPAWPSARPGYLRVVQQCDLAAALLRELVAGRESPGYVWRQVVEAGRLLDNPHEPRNWSRFGSRLVQPGQEQAGRDLHL